MWFIVLCIVVELSVLSCVVIFWFVCWIVWYIILSLVMIKIFLFLVVYWGVDICVVYCFCRFCDVFVYWVMMCWCSVLCCCSSDWFLDWCCVLCWLFCLWIGGCWLELCWLVGWCWVGDICMYWRICCLVDGFLVVVFLVFVWVCGIVFSDMVLYCCCVGLWSVVLGNYGIGWRLGIVWML